MPHPPEIIIPSEENLHRYIIGRDNHRLACIGVAVEIDPIDDIFVMGVDYDPDSSNLLAQHGVSPEEVRIAIACAPDLREKLGFDPGAKVGLALKQVSSTGQMVMDLDLGPAMLPAAQWQQVGRNFDGRIALEIHPHDFFPLVFRPGGDLTRPKQMIDMPEDDAFGSWLSFSPKEFATLLIVLNHHQITERGWGQGWQPQQKALLIRQLKLYKEAYPLYEANNGQLWEPGRPKSFGEAEGISRRCLTEASRQLIEMGMSHMNSDALSAGLPQLMQHVYIDPQSDMGEWIGTKCGIRPEIYQAVVVGPDPYKITDTYHQILGNILGARQFGPMMSEGEMTDRILFLVQAGIIANKKIVYRVGTIGMPAGFRSIFQKDGRIMNPALLRRLSESALDQEYRFVEKLWREPGRAMQLLWDGGVQDKADQGRWIYQGLNRFVYDGKKGVGWYPDQNRKVPVSVLRLPDKIVLKISGLSYDAVRDAVKSSKEKALSIGSLMACLRPTYPFDRVDLQIEICPQAGGGIQCKAIFSGEKIPASSLSKFSKTIQLDIVLGMIFGLSASPR